MSWTQVSPNLSSVPSITGLGGSQDNYGDVPTPFLIPELLKISHADSNYAY